MTKEEKAEYENLINLWNCSEPMTVNQVARYQKLDALACKKHKATKKFFKGAVLLLKKRKPWKQS